MAEVFPGLEAHLIKNPPDNGRAKKLHSHVSRLKKWRPAQTLPAAEAIVFVATQFFDVYRAGSKRHWYQVLHSDFSVFFQNPANGCIVNIKGLSNLFHAVAARGVGLHDGWVAHGHGCKPG